MLHCASRAKFYSHHAEMGQACPEYLPQERVVAGPVPKVGSPCEVAFPGGNPVWTISHREAVSVSIEGQALFQTPPRFQREREPTGKHELD